MARYHCRPFQLNRLAKHFIPELFKHGDIVEIDLPVPARL